jgi:hypothetical protein
MKQVKKIRSTGGGGVAIINRVVWIGLTEVSE